MTLYTGRYYNVPDPTAVIIRTTVGKPKAEPTFADQCYVELLSAAPWGIFKIASMVEFRPKYRHRLHQRFGHIQTEIEQIRASHPGRKLVLCCYDRDPARCHRSLLAEFWTQQTGETVIELSPCAHEESRPAPAPDPQLSFDLKAVA